MPSTSPPSMTPMMLLCDSLAAILASRSNRLINSRFCFRCPFRKSLASSLELSRVWPRRIESPLEPTRTGTEPGPSPPLLSPGLTERDPTHQRRPVIGPAIGMGVMAVVVLQERTEPSRELLRRGEVAVLQESPHQDAEPQ